MLSANSPGFPLQSFPIETTTFINAKVETAETQNELLHRVELPGLKEGEVTVEIEKGNVLKISGERCLKKEEKCHVVSYSGQFMRRFRLPSNSKPNETQCIFQNGVVTVRVPKENTPKRIPIIINTSATDKVMLNRTCDKICDSWREAN